jgi:hypothetical protein
MPFNNFLDKGQHNLNDRNHVLNLFTGIRMHVGSRLYNRDRKIRSGTLFFRPNRILPADESAGTTAEPIPIGQII